MRSRQAWLAALALSAAALSCSSEQDATVRSAATVTPVEVLCGDGNCLPLLQPGGCQWIAGRAGIPGTFTDVRVSSPLVGRTTVTSGGTSYTIDLQEDGTTFGWTATGPVDFVVATSVVDSNVYLYAPPATGDTGLTAFRLFPLTQALFCLRQGAALSASATASGGFTRTYGWHLAKSSPTASATAAVGATVDVAYAVSVDAAAFDSAWVASGTVTIHNPSTVLAGPVTVDASFAGTTVVPTCGTASPLTIPAGGTVTCSWRATPGPGLDGTFVATVSSPGAPAVRASAPVSFASPTAIVDGCVGVTDDMVGFLGTVCGSAALARPPALAAPAGFSYRHALGPFTACDPFGEGYAATNTATYRAPSGATGSASWTVRVMVPCTSAGCTLTQGYWKNHSRQGPAPYDRRWGNLGPREEATPFFLSGQTWLEVFRTPVRGSAYYALAHQYMAAKLNVLAGASPAALGDALARAEAFFAAATPATTLTAARRTELLLLAALLDDFNSGRIGPGHCDGGGGAGCKGGGDDDEGCREADDERGERDVRERDGRYDEAEHERCRAHDRDDRRRGCSDRAEHERCRDLSWRDAERR